MSTAVLERPTVPPPDHHDDPTTQYAERVVAGEIVAGRAVRQACQRHLDDLRRQHSESFPLAFDRGAAGHIIDFFPTFLTLEEGQPFVLAGWQAFCLGSIFGWKRVTDGRRRFQTAYIETGKGSGKSPMLAAVGLYGLMFEDTPSGEIYSAAFDRDQASIILNDAIRMAESSPLADELEIGKYNIAHLPSRSFFRALSSEHRSKSGPRPSIALIDEVHEHRDGTVVAKIRAGFKNRPQPLLLEITNAGADRTSICWEHHQHSLAILDGALQDEAWFAYVCQLDPCDACHGEGYRQPKDGCADCDHWTDPAVWPKTNPAQADLNLPRREYLESQVSTAQTLLSEQALIKRLNFCIWTETHQVWIPADRWDACKVDSVSAENTAGKACAAGLDPASVEDLAAFVVAIRHDDPPGTAAPEVEIDELDEHGERIRQAYRLNFHVELVPTFWIPQQTLLERVRTERVPMDVWERQEKLIATPGPAIDHHAIYDYVLSAWKRFKIQKLGMDENGGRYLFLKLQKDGRLGDQIVSVGQGYKLSEAFKFIEMLVAHRRLWHDGHPVLAWCLANAEPDRHKRTGALALVKPSETKRIDGAIATAMAIHQLMPLPVRKPGVGVFVV